MKIISVKTERRLRNAFITLAIICLTPLCERGRMLSGAHSANVFAGQDLTCVIDLGDEMYAEHGLETGMNYELLNRFADDNRCNVRIITPEKGTDYLDSLKQGRVDIIITHNHDVQDIKDSIEISRPLNSCSVWAVSKDSEAELMQINRWISHMTGSDEYPAIVRRFSVYGNPIRKAEKGVTCRTISPYDDLFRKYAAQLGWDWRMLAAVVYQESKFSINSRSYRGAQGLMQVKTSTAEYYGVDNLLDPEKNLMAGTKHLKRLQRQFEKSGMESIELVKFTLAAYNAGEGRIADCRNFAQAKGVDADNWANIVNLIPQMRDDSILEEESVKLGKFQGYETIAYVEGIMSLYEAFCTICPSI
jgi:membrane-bound lytic murein transglycosylase F